MIQFSMRSTLLVILLLPLQLLSQAFREGEAQTDTLAEVGGKFILAQDLIDRIELMPWPGKDNISEMDSVKVKALQSLVAEQILAMDAAAQGLGADSALRRQVKNLERIMVRDRLFKEEVIPKVKVSEKEVSEGLKRFAWNVQGLMLGTQSQGDAKKLTGAIHLTDNRDSVMAHPPTDLPITIDSINVRFGLLERSQEDAVYALSEAHPVSQPLNVPKLGWVVLSFLTKTTNPEYEKRSIGERTSAVKKIIRRRKEVQEGDRYSADLLAPQRAQANPEMFELFARTIFDLFKSDSLTYRNNTGYRLDFVVDAAEDRLKPYLRRTLVEMDGGGMAIEDVLEAYRTFDFLLPGLDKDDVWKRLNASIREVVAREYIAREGYRQKLNRDPEVERDVGTWANFWLSGLLKDRILKDVSVSDSEIVEYLVGRADVLGHAYEVNVREILVDSLSGAISVLEKISAGENMSTLARRISKRKAWAERGGESGFFPVSEHPVIGFRALEADTGGIIGPLRTPEGYSLFTVLGRRKIPGGNVPAFDSLKAQIGQGLLTGKEQEQLNQYVASSARRYRVKLFYNHLKNIDIAPTNMVTKRFLGFGGTMIAVPALPPLWDWVPRAHDVMEILP